MSTEEIRGQIMGFLVCLLFLRGGWVTENPVYPNFIEKLIKKQSVIFVFNLFYSTLLAYVYQPFHQIVYSHAHAFI